jgi:hypothetical protein
MPAAMDAGIRGPRSGHGGITTPCGNSRVRAEHPIRTAECLLRSLALRFMHCPSWWRSEARDAVVLATRLIMLSGR